MVLKNIRSESQERGLGSIVDAVIQSNKTVKVVAIEAIPDKARFLRKNFPSIVVIVISIKSEICKVFHHKVFRRLNCLSRIANYYNSCAVGAESGQTTFYINPNQSSYSTLVRSKKDANCIEINVDINKDR